MGHFRLIEFDGIEQLIKPTYANSVGKNDMLNYFSKFIRHNCEEIGSNIDELENTFGLSYGSYEGVFVIKLDELNKVYIDNNYYMHHLFQDYYKNIYLACLHNYQYRWKYYKIN